MQKELEASAARGKFVIKALRDLQQTLRQAITVILKMPQHRIGLQ